MRPSFRCFEPRPHGFVACPPPAFADKGDTGDTYSKYHRVAEKRPSAADAVAKRRADRGEDPETGIPLGSESKAKTREHERARTIAFVVLALLAFIAWWK